MHLPGASRVELEAMPDAVEAKAPDPDLLRRASMGQADRKAREATAAPDRLLVQAVQAMDEMQRAVNLLDERLREWEPVSADADHAGDAKALESFQAARSDAESTRQALEAHVSALAEEIAPNVSALVDPLICARLVQLAGGLEKLARMPAGTIQTLGAEEALFAHLTEGAPPPKHGVLFQNPMVHRAPYKARGSISRALAAKVAIAARADAYTGAELAGKLKEDLDRRVEEAKRRAGQKGRRKGKGKGKGTGKGQGRGGR